MFKKSVLLFLILRLSTVFANPAEIPFDMYFHNQTLRIDYHRFRSIEKDSVEIYRLFRKQTWEGSRQHLIDIPGYANTKVEMWTSDGKNLLFAHEYNTLAGEWATLEEAKDSLRVFEETVLLPLPKHAVNIRFFSRNSDGKWITVSNSLYIDNKKSITIPLVQDNYEKIALHHSGEGKFCVDIMFVPDGFDKNDSALMKEKMEMFANTLLHTEPFSQYKDKLNLWGLTAYSEHSGIPITSVSETQTVACTHFNTFNSERYLMTDSTFRLHNAIGNHPCEHIIIICNTDKYGGGGIYNFYATVSLDKTFASKIMLHELGHSFGGLGDEYAENDISTITPAFSKEPLEPNLTTLVDFSSKWKKQMRNSTPIPTPSTTEYSKEVGVYEGASYQPKGIYRPFQSCMMRDYAPFCPVCAEILHRQLLRHCDRLQ